MFKIELDADLVTDKLCGELNLHNNYKEVMGLF